MEGGEPEISFKEYKQAKEAYNNLKKYNSAVKEVIKNEKADRADNPIINYAQNLGSQQYKTLLGYRVLIEGYLATQDIPNIKLANISRHIDEMRLQAKEYQFIFSTFSKAINRLSQNVENIESQNSAYISYINISDIGEKHANIIKYSKENDKYYRTIYNAGMDADIDNNKLDQSIKDKLVAASKNKSYKGLNAPLIPIYSAIKFPLKTKYQSKEGIKKVMLQELKDSRNSSKNNVRAHRHTIVQHKKDIEEHHKKFFDNPIVDDKALMTNAQFLGNCTTRSIREALRHNIDSSTFRELYNYVTKIKPSEMLEMLESKIKSYENRYGKSLTARIKDFVTAVIKSEEKVEDFFAATTHSSPTYNKLLLDRLAEENAIPNISKEENKELWHKAFSAMVESKEITLFPKDQARIRKCFEDVLWTPDSFNNEITDENKENFITTLQLTLLQDTNISLDTKVITLASMDNIPIEIVKNIAYDESLSEERITEDKFTYTKMQKVERPTFDKDTFLARRKSIEKNLINKIAPTEELIQQPQQKQLKAIKKEFEQYSSDISIKSSSNLHAPKPRSQSHRNSVDQITHL
ncbi:hypothetical protein [Rickettsia endosymbiont of Halotydeus destructor]|uniref:hypothetical protein n=1 Tax=Rickettsia endosymbiont of Halotydeus destructor TaxID=2996754 RepID=UPI003BB195DB